VVVAYLKLLSGYSVGRSMTIAILQSTFLAKVETEYPTNTKQE
jgi:hypothetical protein